MKDDIFVKPIVDCKMRYLFNQSPLSHYSVLLMLLLFILQIKDSLGSRLATEDKDQLESLMTSVDQQHQLELDDMHNQHVVSLLSYKITLSTESLG